MKSELTEQFGGLTAYTRSPADGLWQADSQSIEHDKIGIFEIVTEALDIPWWKQYRKKLEQEFSQESIQILAQEVRKI